MNMHKELLKMILQFDWDEGNIPKNWNKHHVSTQEAEEAFTNDHFFMTDDKKHSITENRYHALGCTRNNRLLFISFTIRNNLVRVISVRDMSAKERELYESKKNQTKT